MNQDLIISLYSNNYSIKGPFKKLLGEINKGPKTIRLYTLNPYKDKIIEYLERSKLLGRHTVIETYDRDGTYIISKLDNVKRIVKKPKKKEISSTLRLIPSKYKYDNFNNFDYICSFLFSLNLTNNKRRSNLVIVDRESDLSNLLEGKIQIANKMEIYKFDKDILSLERK